METPDKKLEKLTSAMRAVSVCRDFNDGALKVLHDKYLPRLTGETDEGYVVRKSATPFPNLLAPIVDTLSGLVTKREPSLQGEMPIDADSVDRKGSSLITFIKAVCQSSIVSGVEFVTVEGDSNQFYFKRYLYEDLVSYQRLSGKLTQIVFKDSLEVASGKFSIKTVVRYVVFKIGGGEVWYDSGQGLRIQDAWDNDLDEIPVVSVATGKKVSDFQYVPALYDVAILNRVVLQLESQLANVLAVVGNPVPIFYGDVSDDGVRVGVKDALVFSDKKTQGFEYVEANGGGVEKISDKIKELSGVVDKMALNLLCQENSTTLVDAHNKQSKSGSTLSDIAKELSVKFNKLLYYANWLKGSPNVESRLEFKTEFDDLLFSDQQLETLRNMTLSGDISRDTFWEKLQLAGVLPADFDADQERDRLERG